MIEKFKPSIINPKEKIKKNILPFLSFPIIDSCTFRCEYCGEDGELTASKKSIATLSFIKIKVEQGYANGVRKFRLTGGEPTLRRDNLLDVIDYANQFLELKGVSVEERMQHEYGTPTPAVEDVLKRIDMLD